MNPPPSPHHQYEMSFSVGLDGSACMDEFVKAGNRKEACRKLSWRVSPTWETAKWYNAV